MGPVVIFSSFLGTMAYIQACPHGSHSTALPYNGKLQAPPARLPRACNTSVALIPPAIYQMHLPESWTGHCRCRLLHRGCTQEQQK